MHIYNHIYDLLHDKKNCVFFEVGARQGEDTVQISSLLPSAQIYAFEPLPSNFQKLFERCFMLEGHNLNDVYQLFQTAIGSFNGKADFWVSSDPENFNGSSSLKKPKDHIEAFPHVKFEEKIQVEVQTLDNFCLTEDVSHIDFLWRGRSAVQRLI